MSNFKLMFNGQLVAGFERKTVIENLAQLLKQSPEVISSFFAGQPRIIKRVESKAVAEKWCAAFAKAGAVLTVVPDHETLPEKTLDSHATSTATSSTHKTSAAVVATANARSTQRFVLIGSVGVLLIALLTTLWLSRALWQSPVLDESQQALLAALASDNIYALGHVDVERIQTLEQFAQHESDLAAFPGIEKDFWSSLEQANIRVRAQVTHVWVAGYFQMPATAETPAEVTKTKREKTQAEEKTQTEKSDALIVVTGVFNPEQITAWVKQRYLLEDESSDGLLVTSLDEQTCEKQPLKLVKISSNRIVVGSPARVADFHARLQAGRAAVPDLTNWHKVSAGQLASLAVFVPKDLAAAVGGLPGMMLREVSAAANPATGLFVGLDTVTFPPGVELSVVVTSDDKEFLNSSHRVISERVAEMKAEATINWPETLALYERFSFTQNDGQLRTALRFDENLQQELSQLVASFLSNSFSVAGDDDNAETERLDDNPPQFVDVNSTTFASFNDVKYLDSQFEPQVVSGPFGIALEHVAINESGPEIALAVKAFNLPNLGERSSAVTLTITDVVDHAGKSLAPVPTCGKDKLREPNKINSSFASKAYVDNQEIPYTSVSGSAQLLLPQGAHLTDIAAVTGVVKFLVPTEIEHVRLTAPLAGQVIEKHGLRIRFFASATGVLQYEYSGAVDSLLHIAALNAEGKPLASSSSMRSQSFFGSSQTVSASYRGDIAGVELVIARKQQTLTYPFELTSLQPTADSSTFPLVPQPTLLTDEQWQRLQKDGAPEIVEFWRQPQAIYGVGPARLVVQDISFSEHFGARLDAEVYLHNQHPLMNVLGAVDLTMTELITTHGTVEPIAMQVQFPVDYEGGMWWNGQYKVDEEKPWLRGSLQLRSEDIKVTEVSSLRGSLSITRAKNIATIDLPLNLGASWSNDMGGVKFVRWEQGQLMFAVSGNVASLVAIQVVNADNVIVSEPADIQWGFGDNAIRVRYREKPAGIRIIAATETEKRSYPVEITITDAEDD